MTSLVEDFDYAGFAQRMKEAMSPEKPTAFAARIGLPSGTLFKYLGANGSTAPRLDIVARIAEGLGVTLDWLVLGRGEGPDDSLEIGRVPIYDVRLAAGAASFTEGAKRLGDMPFDRELLKQLGRTSTEGLGLVEAEGDSMEPTIPDGARVLIDLNDTRLREGVFGFRYEDQLRVKRLRRVADGVEIMSDNTRYSSELLLGSDLGSFQVIGRVKWLGVVL